MSGGRDQVVLSSGELEATFLPALGMVASSLRHRGEEVLGQRGGPQAYAERKSTFGIPLLYPWANRLGAWQYSAAGRTVELRGEEVLKADGDTGLPIHGSLSASPHWKLVSATAARLRASLDYAAHPELMAVFPFAHVLELEAGLGPEVLTVRLRVRAGDQQPVPISFGFHPYIALPGSDRDDWEVELPVARRALLDENGIPTGEHEELAPGALSGSLAGRSFDDSFDLLDGDPPVFSVADGSRRVEVVYGAGYPVAQVYSPQDAELVAFEPMTAPVDALRSGQGLRLLAPREQFTAEFQIRVSSR